jgi:hypothetical protein
LIDLTIPASANDTFTARAGSGLFDFAGLTAIVLPLLAVLLATHVQPVVGRAKQITIAAAAEYAVSAVFAAIALLGWLVGSLADAAFRVAFTGLLVRAAFLLMFAVAALIVFKVWRTLYYVPRPKAQPGVYGKPRPYGQQPGYSPAYGQPPIPQQVSFTPDGPEAERTQVIPQGGGDAGLDLVIGRPAGGDAGLDLVIGRPAGGDVEPTQVIGRPADGEAERTQVVRRPADGEAERTQVIPPADDAGSRPATRERGDEPTDSR